MYLLKDFYHYINNVIVAKRKNKKRNENKKAFFITIINISVVKPEQFCARKEKTRGVTLNVIQLSVHFIIIMIQSFLYILLSS